MPAQKPTSDRIPGGAEVFERGGQRPRGLTLENWLDPPYNRWSFSHVREFVPTQRISRGVREPSSLHPAPREVGSVAVVRSDGTSATLQDVVGDTFTDALVVTHRGMVVAEQYYGEMRADTPHALMSISKAFIGCVAGWLVGSGVLRPSGRVTDYLPELKSSGYAGATVRNLLDMRSGVRFSEDTDDPSSEVWGLLRAMGWAPGPGYGVSNSMYNYLSTLVRERDHGGAFSYRDCDADVLGWVCERAAGERMAELLSGVIWARLGAEYDAEITCDALGSAGHDGGMSTTARDLARFGLLLLAGGDVGEEEVVPGVWLRSSWNPPADIVEACRGAQSAFGLPGAWYRNLLWFAPRSHGTVLLCRGAFGQLIYVDPARQIVAVKFSSWPVTAMTAASQAVSMTEDTLLALDAVGEDLAGGRPGGTG